jgi:hypothetical protein
MRKMSFYKIEIEFEGKQILFLCSYKLLPLSLHKIALDFTTVKKMPFPYLFSSLENLYYSGNVPDLKF